MTATAGAARDRWAVWLLERRFGGDAAQRDAMMPALRGYRDEVLRRAAIRVGDTVLDVGCGDGLIGFGAADLVGPSGRVVFSDISADLLAACREIASAASQAGAPAAPATGSPAETSPADASPADAAPVDKSPTDASPAGNRAPQDDRSPTAGQPPLPRTPSTRPPRFDFVQTGLPGLDGIEPQSVHVATTRSVLIYVADVAGAFVGLHRVLKPGGRLSIFEPINRFGRDTSPHRLWGCDMSGLESIAAKVRTQMETYASDLGTMLAFDERDLLRAAERAGFVDVRLTYDAEITTHGGTVDGLLRQSPNPLVPALADVVDAALTPDERATLRRRFADELAAGRQEHRLATVFLSARRR